MAANADPQSNTDQPAAYTNTVEHEYKYSRTRVQIQYNTSTNTVEHEYKYSTVRTQIQTNPCNIPVIGMLRPTWEPLGMSKLPNWRLMLRPTIDNWHAWWRPHPIFSLTSKNMRAIRSKTSSWQNQSQTNWKSQANSLEVLNEQR